MSARNRSTARHAGQRPRRRTVIVDRVLGTPRPTPHVRGIPGPTQTMAGRRWEHHPHLIRAAALAALVWGVVYLTWRVVWSWDGANPVLWWLLLVTEMFGWVSLVGFTVYSWRRRQEPAPTARRAPLVDIYVCTYDESVEILRTTLAGCRMLAYPHRTYLLDDGRRPEMAELAEQMGATWITRADNRHAKAGNINAALPQTDGELIFVLDADHVPLPDALDSLIGYLDDPMVALVQSPHDFYNHDSVQHYEFGRHEQSVFYSVVMPGKDRLGAAFWCGSAALIRREALLDVGGVATETIAEDFHTTIKLHRRGWDTRYHDEVLIQGLAPHGLDAYLLQRDRWARGNLAVLTTPESPLRASELTLAQRLSYAGSLLAYLAGPVRLLALGVLAAVIWTGALPMKATLFTLGVFWLPFVVLSMLAAQALGRGFSRLVDTVHFELLTAEIHLRALRCAVHPGRGRFKVTPKEGVDLGGWPAVRRLHLVLLGTVVLAVGLLGRVLDAVGLVALPDLPGIAAWVVPILALIELRRCLRTLRVIGRRRQRRAEYRVATDVVAVAATGQGPVPARVLNVAPSGLAIRTARALPASSEITVTLELPTVADGDRRLQVPATVRSCRWMGDGWLVGARATADDATRAVLVEYCNVVHPFARLRGPSQETLLTVPIDEWAAELDHELDPAMDAVQSGAGPGLPPPAGRPIEPTSAPGTIGATMLADQPSASG